jgi:hypothetical protein
MNTEHAHQLLDFVLAEDTAPARGAEVKAAYEAWVEADRVWMAELEKAFGKDACNRRFDLNQDKHPTACKVACLKWQAAGSKARRLLGWDKPAEVGAH